ncbi:MAG: hypothetical protein RL653_4492, partial [Pseudomonadota bacterium]
VDTVPPDTELTQVPPSPSNQPTATFAFQLVAPPAPAANGPSSPKGSTPDFAFFECSLDGAAFTPCVSPTTYTGLSAGPHLFEVRAVDTAGNRDPSPAFHGWTFDPLPPDTVLSAGPAPFVRVDVADFTAASPATDVVGYLCALDGAPAAACPVPLRYAGLSEGPHALEVAAVDAAGNVDPTPAEWAWTVDLTAPETTITSQPAALVNVASATLDFGSEPGAAFLCSLDGAAFSPCSAPVTLGGLLEGPHTFVVKAVDLAGNEDASAASASWTVDLTAPETTITAQPAAVVNVAVASVEFNSEPGASFLCSLDGAAFTPCTSPVQLSGLSEGAHALSVKAVDAAGNEDATAAAAAWTVDLTAPETTLVSKPATLVNVATATLDFGSDDTTATFECSVDGAAFTACTAPVQLSGLAEGAHSVSVRAVDAVGNVDATPATATWTVDLTAPETTFTQVPEPGAVGNSATFAFTSSEPGSTFLCSLDGATAAPCTSPWTLSALSDGAHTFSVYAVDAAGNPDGTPATHTWTVTGDADTDSDGLRDGEELALGTNPDDEDSDDDGVADGEEPEPGADTDGDGTLNALDPDSDGDKLLDGTELGVSAPLAGTDTSKLHFRADADPATKTDPLLRDTDQGGVPDGAEDFDGNGRVDAREFDPLLGSDDIVGHDEDGDGIQDLYESPADTDGDGVADAIDEDADGDGVLDVVEAQPLLAEGQPADTDGDGTPDFQDTDSDADGLLDGKENCRTAANPGQEDRDGDGTGDACDPDADGDGVPDRVDTCPNTPDGKQLDLDGDGKGDACDVDDDNDGYVDEALISGGGCTAAPVTLAWPLALGAWLLLARRGGRRTRT